MTRRAFPSRAGAGPAARTRPTAYPATLWTLALMALWLGGCAARAAEAHRYEIGDDELSQAGTLPGGQVWQSAPWSGGPWIRLPGRASVTLTHELGALPSDVSVYLSFTKDDTGDQSSRQAFPAAGDVANVADITDEEVTVINTAQADFYMRVVLR